MNYVETKKGYDIGFVNGGGEFSDLSERSYELIADRFNILLVDGFPVEVRGFVLLVSLRRFDFRRHRRAFLDGGCCLPGGDCRAFLDGGLLPLGRDCRAFPGGLLRLNLPRLELLLSEQGGIFGEYLIRFFRLLGDLALVKRLAFRIRRRLGVVSSQMVK